MALGGIILGGVFSRKSRLKAGFLMAKSKGWQGEKETENIKIVRPVAGY